MTDIQFQNEISIIKEMINKTKRETANYGNLFVLPGYLLIIMLIVIKLLNSYEMEQFTTLVLIISVAIIAIVSAAIGVVVSKKKSVITYTSRIFSHTWLISGMACILTGIIFPLAGVYPISYAPYICWPILGVAFYLTGIFYEFSLISAFSIAWFAGAALMAFLPDDYSVYITLVTIILGYITPGMILNKKYKTGEN